MTRRRITNLGFLQPAMDAGDSGRLSPAILGQCNFYRLASGATFCIHLGEEGPVGFHVEVLVLVLFIVEV